MNDDTKSLSCLASVDGAPVPLVGVSLTGTVFGAHARLVLRQRYKNRESKPIEAIYTFPVPSEAAVVGFAMEAEGRRLEADVKEREVAFKEYDEAISKGHGAALLDQERRNVFTASVGNLLPGEETVVEVAYVQSLTADEGALRLAIPTLVAPRYIPGEKQGDRTGHGVADPTDRVPDADRISPRIGAVSYGLALDLLFDLGRDVTIESPSHAIVVASAGDRRQRVTFGGKEPALDRDLVLLASGAPGTQAGVVSEKTQGKDGTFALTVVPDLFDGKKVDARRDVVFVIDVSGSMGGLSIDQAKSALRLCLRHLSEGDRFDVIAFQSSFTSYAARLVPFTQKTLAEADAWVDALVANGGTEMLHPLLAAVKEGDASAERDRIVVLLTDGEVGNEAEIVTQVVDAAKGVRFYTFGIGTNVSDLLLRDLARRTRGAVEMIYPGERIDAKVTAQFARAIAERVTHVEVRFEGVDAGELAPSALPDLVDGEPWVVYGRFTSPGVGRATLRGSLRGERFAMDVPIDLVGEATREGLAALWAASRVRDLEVEGEKLEGRRATANKDRIVALAIEHRVASRFTSFIVVEHRVGDRRATGLPETRAVPVSAPHGWAEAAPRPQQAVLRSASFGAAVVRSPMPAAPAAFGPPPGAAYDGSAPKMKRVAPPPSASATGGYGAPPPPPAFAPPAPPPPAGRPMPKPAMPGRGGAFPLEEMARKREAADPIQALFERQAWDGLWDDGDASDKGRLLATARALAQAFAARVDSSHAVYGAQIKKAVDAIETTVAKLAWTKDLEDAASAAIAAAVLVAASSRIKQRLVALVRASASTNVQGLERDVATEELAKKRLASLGISC